MIVFFQFGGGFMFIYLQNRTDILGSFFVKIFRRTENNEIVGVIDWATEDKPEQTILLGEYNNEEEAKSVMKLLLSDMKRREQTFVMPKKDGVAKMLKIAAERAAAAKKLAAEKEARRAAEEERRAAKAAKEAAKAQKKTAAE